MAVQTTQFRQALEELEKLPAPARFGILGAVCLVLVALYWFAVGSGANQQVTMLKAQVTQLQDEIAEARAVASNLRSFKERREQLQAQLDEALLKLPDQKELPGLLTDMSSLGKKSGLEVRSFTPTGENLHGFYAEVPIQVELYGSYHDVGIFFDRLARLQRIVNISQMDMTVENASGDRPKLRVKGTATTFRFLEKSGAEAGE